MASAPQRARDQGRKLTLALPPGAPPSFAERTPCPVIHYLAQAQFPGLIGLWQKLCAGKLPARCDKQWFFATFCGVPEAKFNALGLESELNGSTDILPHLNGCGRRFDDRAPLALPRRETAHNAA
jgi:hypothetical protein